MQRKANIGATFGKPKINATFGYVPRPKDTITGSEIADLLNMKYATFTRRRHQLIELGMPRPIPGGVMVWSRTNLMAWINGAGAVHAMPGAAKDPVEIARDALEARLAGGAQ